MRRETAQEIDSIAAHWVARVDRGLSQEEARQLEEWLAGDPRRLGAYGRFEALSLHAERASALRPTGGEAELMRPPLVTRRKFMLAGGGMAAAAALGAGGIHVQRSLSRQQFHTRLGEVQVAPLADGSVVTLNTLTTIQVEFTRALRKIWLTSGEALFEVMTGDARPFIVAAGAMTVQASAASFIVQLTGRSVARVLVQSGNVGVRRADEDFAETSRVTQQKVAVVDSGQQPLLVSDISHAALERELAWREGRLAFEGETLREAARQFARYSGAKLVIDDPVVAEARITGLFRANDPVGFARSAALALNLHAEVGASEVRITRGKAGGQKGD